MFLGLITIILAVLLFDTRSRLGRLDRRLRQIEEDRRQSFAGAAASSHPEIPIAVPVSIPEVPSPAAAAVAPPEPVMAMEAAEPAPVRLESEAAVPVSPAAPPRPGSTATPNRSLSFEDLFGRKLPIWGGGITLAVAGMLIVRYSIEAGLLSPLVRVITGLLFGSGLIAAAEVALRRDNWVRDARIRQALAGAGIATLYASILVAANLYGLISPVAAFVGMAFVTALAIGLSLRFGAASALLGLVGGLAAPALVGSGEPNIPLLSVYLALTVGGLCVLSRSQRWVWLGIASLIGGFGWGGILLFAGALDLGATLSIGLYLLLLGIALPAVTAGGKARTLLRLGGSLAAAGQMAALVAVGGFTLLHWGLFGLISAALIWLSRQESRFAPLAAVGLVVGLLLIGAWPNPSVGTFALVLAGAGLIYGIPAFIRLWSSSGSLLDAGQLAGLAVGAMLVTMLHYFRADGAVDLPFARLGIGLSLISAGAALPCLRITPRGEDWRFALLATTAAALLMAAAAFALPAWLLAPAAAVLASALLLLRLRIEDRRLEPGAWIAVTLALGLAIATADGWSEIGRASGLGSLTVPLHGLLRWGGGAAAFALFAWKARWHVARTVAQALAALLFTVAAAQCLAGEVLPLIPALALPALVLWGRRLPEDRLVPALATMVALVLAWALLPLAEWTISALGSIGGRALLVGDVPAPEKALLRLALPALLTAGALWQTRQSIGLRSRRLASVVIAVLGGVALHMLFKQLFAIAAPEAFVARGLAERTAWEFLLLVGSALAWRVAADRAYLRLAARALWVAAVGHFLWYSLLLHNPLWAAQAVGPLPLLNLLLPAYGVAAAAIWLITRRETAVADRWGRVIGIASMLLILLFAFSELRQLFQGSILATTGVVPLEDILRSVFAIALGIAFLLRGIARKSRDWRIASLLLMLGAIGKVFLLDTSGLEGLLRILSFVALGISLITIGWIYSRYLTDDRPAAAV